MSAKKTALITGVTGQDGAYLAKLLLEKNYRVVGAVRRASTLNLPRLAALNIDRDVELQTLDVQDLTSIVRMIETIQPDEIYNLSGQSSPQASFQQPLYTGQTVGLGILRLMEAVKLVNPAIRIFEAASSEIFGLGSKNPICEKQDFHPRSPYGVAKLFAYWSVVNSREAHGLHASNGIMFSHESPLRGMEFVTRKIVLGLCKIKLNRQKTLYLGNLYAKRDWGHAKDYVRGMWMITQHEQPDDFVLATGKMYSVREFVENAAEYFGFKIQWRGEGLQETGYCPTMGRDIIRVSEKYYRPTEVEQLLGDATKAKQTLEWSPTISFQDLVKRMVQTEVQSLKQNTL